MFKRLLGGVRVSESMENTTCMLSVCPLFSHFNICVCASVRYRLCYNKIEMEEINAPARGPGRVTNHLIRGKREEPELSMNY